MDYKELKADYERLKASIEAYHLFYSDFNAYALLLSNSQGLLVEMYSSVVELKKKGNNSTKIIEQEDRLKSLLSNIEALSGLNNLCQSQKLKIKHQAQDYVALEFKANNLEKELTAIKEAFNK